MDIPRPPAKKESSRDTPFDTAGREAEVRALLNAAKAVLEHHNFEDAARAIFTNAKELIGATAGYVALFNENATENEVIFLDSGGEPCRVDPALPMPIRGLREIAYRIGRTVYENEFAGTDYAALLPEGHVRVGNVMFAPLLIDGKTVGLLGLANKPEPFNDNDARLASGFTELAAIALTNKWAEEKRQGKGNQDQL
jgi:GAF domain-containing protein